MIEKLKHKYALSDKGAKDMVRAIFAVALANLVLMMPVGLLYFLASYLLDGEVPREKLPFFIAAIVVILLLIVLTSIFQYRSTFFSTYVESGVRRRTLAEKLRKIPLSFFGKKDLADLTNTIMADCALLETASSHWIPELILLPVEDGAGGDLGHAGGIFDRALFQEVSEKYAGKGIGLQGELPGRYPGRTGDRA